MSNQHAEPAGLGAVAVLNIVFGTLGTLMWGAGLVISALLAATGASVGPLGVIVAGVGIVAIPVTAAGTLIHGMLLFGGLRLLRRIPSGRSLSLIYAWVAIIINAVWMLVSGFGTLWCNLLGVAYPVVLLVLLNRPDWRTAFDPGRSVEATGEAE